MSFVVSRHTVPATHALSLAHAAPIAPAPAGVQSTMSWSAPWNTAVCSVHFHAGGTRRR